MFKWFARLIMQSEQGLIDLLSSFVPYLVPIPSAYLTFYHTLNMMQFPDWVAWSSAVTVETLGIVSMNTAIKFYYNNQRYKDAKQKAPFLPAAATYAFYIFIILLVNVVLEWVKLADHEIGARSGWVIFAIAAFGLLSVPSGLLIAIRAQFADILEYRDERRKPRPAVAEQSAEESKPGLKKTKRKKYASHFRDKITTLLNDAYRDQGRVLSPKEITGALNLDHDKSKGFVSKFTSDWMSANGISPEAKKKPMGFKQ